MLSGCSEDVLEVQGSFFQPRKEALVKRFFSNGSNAQDMTWITGWSSSWADDQVLETDGGDGCTTSCPNVTKG